VNELILPVPLAASPIDVLLLVHVYEVPVPEKLTPVVELPLHIVWLPTGFTDGVGFTDTTAVTVAPVQVRPPDVNEGVIDIDPPMVAVPELVAVNVRLPVPLPLEASPIAVLVLVQV
jgi:hypothetical protein